MRASRVLLITTLLLAGGCATGRAYREFDVRFAGAEPAPLAPGADDAALLETVAWLMANRLALPAVRGSTMPRQFFPSLRELEGHAAWTAARNRLGSAATYGQAFLAVDWLVERHSIEALHEFLRRTGRESGAWGSVFATSYAEFVDEFRARLQRLE